MILWLRKYIVPVIILATLVASTASAQNLTGIWRGYFITDGYDQYKFELQIEQSKKKGITGVSYSYLTTVFYGKATLTGNYNTASKTALVQEIRTVEVRMSHSSVACIMKCLLEYTKSGKEEFLEGSYTSRYEKADLRSGVRRGEGCGGGKVFLRKVPTSDFYVEPFLRDKPSVRKQTTAGNKPETKTPPPTTKVVPKKTPGTPPRKVPAPPISQKPVPKKPTATSEKKDTTRRSVQPPIAKVEAAKPSTPLPLNIPATTRSRQNELAQTVVVTSKEVQVRLYDNGEIDDDTISVYLNNQLVLANKRLSASPIALTLKLNEDQPEHVLVMVAENMGRIPPNTSLMIVQDGDKRYQVRITSTNQKNAMVRFRYQGSD